MSHIRSARHPKINNFTSIPSRTSTTATTPNTNQYSSPHLINTNTSNSQPINTTLARRRSSGSIQRMKPARVGTSIFTHKKLPLSLPYATLLLLCITRLHHAHATTCGTTSAASVFTSSTDNTYRYIATNACPPYDWTGQGTPTAAAQQAVSVRVPLHPTIASSPLYVGTSSPLLGAIGIASNGVLMYGPTDVQGRDAKVYEGTSFDACGGHTDGQGHYHYHTNPLCAYTGATGQHSPLAGFMFDGIPIFGLNGDNGVPPTDLDECNGHVDATHPYYHYHASSSYPYLVNCLRGCVDGSALSGIQGGITGQSLSKCTAASTQYDYSGLDSLGLPWTSYGGGSAGTTPAGMTTASTTAATTAATTTAATTTKATSSSSTSTTTRTSAATTTVIITTSTTKITTTVTTRAPPPSSISNPPPPSSSNPPPPRPPQPRRRRLGMPPAAVQDAPRAAEERPRRR